MHPSFLVALAVLPLLGPGQLSGQNGPVPRIVANDNRAPAGVLRDGVLRVRLEIGRGEWHPGAEDGAGIAVNAFGEGAGALQVPGPLIRVPLGTTIEATIHDGLPVAATLHGLRARSGEMPDAITLQAGETRAIRFPADVVGTFYYWAATSDTAVTRRRRVDSQLQGGLIVDPPGAPPADRLFLLSLWIDRPDSAPEFDGVAAINGKEWPYTERLSYRQGETVHWRVINLSVVPHAMHLHGSYFRVDATGDERERHAFAEADRLMVVTERIPPGATFESTWVPPRAGRWIFHCHMLRHMSPPASGPGLQALASHARAPGDHADATGMGGLVLGITVSGTQESGVQSPPPARNLELIVGPGRAPGPGYQLELRETDAPARVADKSAGPRLLGPPIMLVRGQPTRIVVHNQTAVPTAIHWHGIELESYYDGVPNWGGSGPQTTPPIAPGASFVARMTPPRAGTFIYHTHWHDAAQLTNGLYGPLIVLEPGQRFDPVADRIFVFSLGQVPPFGDMLLINGEPQPVPVRLAPGRKYRLRLINIAPDQAAMQASLLQAGRPVQWRLLAKDGADVPATRAVLQPAQLGITVGETYDFELEPAGPAELVLEFYLPGPKKRVTQTILVGRGAGD